MDSVTGEQRLLYRESALGTFGSVGKIANKLQAFIVSRDQASFDNFMKEFHNYRLDMEGVFETIATYEQEVDVYNKIRDDIVTKISQTEATILRLEVELNQEKQIRRHKELCETTATTVTVHENIPAISRKIEGAQLELESNLEELKRVERQIMKRNTQFKDLLNCLNILKQDLVEDEVNAESSEAMVTEHDDENRMDME